MKQALTIQGRVELDRHEITIAITEWLRSKYNLLTTKSVYVTDGKTVSKAVVEVKQAKTDTGIPDFSVHEKSVRKAKRSYRRNNVGINSFLREYLSDEKKRKNKEIQFDDLFKAVKDFFPKMDENHLNMYLYDRRQLPGIKFKDKVITIG